MSAGLVLTNSGSAEIEAAYQAGETVKITLCSFGDGGGEPVTADPSATALKGRFGEVPLSAGDAFDGMIGGMAIIPCADYPGQIVREFGLESESGTLIAYGAYPETYLPAQGDSVIKELVVKFVMPLVHAENVTLIVDPNIAIITQEEGDKRYYRRALRLQEVQDEGAAAQQELRENIGCGTSATKDVVTSPTDTTAGRVLTVGYHGLGSVAPRTPVVASNNYDNIPTGLTSGFWTHAVSGGPYAHTFTLFQDGGGQTQSRHLIIPVDPNNGRIAFRWDGATAAGSKDYQYFYTDKNKPTAADVGALRLQLTNLSADLNTLGEQTDAGLYQQQLSANATTAKYYPIAEAGSLLVSPSAYGCQQEYTSYSSRRKFIRGLTGTFNGSGPWTAWTELYSPQYPGEIYGTSANNFRIAYGGYGTFWRNDGANLYLMLTNKDAPLGDYNALRPFAVNLATGDVTIGKLGLVNYENFDARYYTQSAANAKFVQGVQWSTEYTKPYGGGAAVKANAGGAITGLQEDQGDNEIHTYYFKTLQVNVNGAWKNVAG